MEMQDEMYKFALGDQLSSIKLGDDGLQDFVADGREDALFVVLSQLGVDYGQLVHLGAMQHSQRQGHGLHV